MLGAVGLGAAKLRCFFAGEGVGDLQHQHALLHPAAEGDPLVRGLDGGLHGIVQGVAQQGAEIHIADAELLRQGDLNVSNQAQPLHLLQLNGEHGVGGLPAADPGNFLTYVRCVPPDPAAGLPGAGNLIQRKNCPGVHRGSQSFCDYSGIWISLILKSSPESTSFSKLPQLGQ